MVAKNGLCGDNKKHHGLAKTGHSREGARGAPPLSTTSGNAQRRWATPSIMRKEGKRTLREGFKAQRGKGRPDVFACVIRKKIQFHKREKKGEGVAQYSARKKGARNKVTP